MEIRDALTEPAIGIRSEDDVNDVDESIRAATQKFRLRVSSDGSSSLTPLITCSVSENDRPIQRHHSASFPS
jgi:hypothetical protein